MGDHDEVHSGSRLFDYSQWRLLGEYTPDGRPVEETVWLGNRPVATVRDHRLYYIHTDHLGTPRVITEPGSGKVVWQWRSGPFGTGQPNEDPSGTGRKFVYNLRFAGQYYDSETGTAYNGFRDYDPAIGRYVESDPIGLLGGLNAYAYVLNDPINMIDPLGLAGFGYTNSQLTAMAETQSAEATIEQLNKKYAPVAAEKVLTSGAIGMGVAALALSGNEEIAGPLSYASFGSSVAATGTKVVTTGKITPSDTIDAALAAVAVKAGPLARIFTHDENLVRTVEFGAGSADVTNSFYQLTHSGYDKLNSPASGSMCSK